jgi:hypothetical protein
VSRNRGIAVLLGLLAVVVLLVLLVGRGTSSHPYDLDDAGDSGYKGLRLVMEETGTPITRLDASEVSASTIEQHPIVLVPDGGGASPAQAERLRRYAEAGGIVVGAGPIGHLGAQSTNGDPATFPSGEGQHGVCTIDGLEDVHGFGVEDQMVPLRVPEGASSCFGDGRRAAVVSVEVGSGRVVTVASPELFTNLAMRPKDQDVDDPKGPMPDDVVLAVRLLTPGGSGASGNGSAGNQSIGVVTSGLADSGTSPGRRTVSQLLSPGVKLGLLQLLAAFVFYAAWRSRRDGRVVAEHLPVEIAGSELVSATGNLMERQGDAWSAASVLRHSTRRDLRRRLGLPADASLQTIAGVVAARSGRAPEEVLAVLGDDPVQDDAALVQLGLTLDRIRQEVIG